MSTRHMRNWLGFLALAAALLFCPSARAGEEKMNFPHIRVDREKREVRIEAKMSKELHWRGSPVEFLLIRNTDRAYESVFTTDADPMHVLVALFAIGLHPGPLPKPEPEGLVTKRQVTPQGERVEEEKPKAETAPMLDMLVEWREGETLRSERIERFLIKRSNDQPARDNPYAFTGSYFVTHEGKKVLVATQTEVISAVLFDPSSLLNLPYYEGSPYAEGVREGFYVVPEKLPKHFHGKSKEIFMPDPNDPSKAIKVKKIVCVDKPVTIVLKPTTLDVINPYDDEKQDKKEEPPAAEGEEVGKDSDAAAEKRDTEEAPTETEEK